MFQFTGFTFISYVFRYKFQCITTGGFPHSEICGSRRIIGSPQLIADYCVLLRLLVPRHPSFALSSFTYTLTGTSCEKHSTPPPSRRRLSFSSLPLTHHWFSYTNLYVCIYLLCNCQGTIFLKFSNSVSFVFSSYLLPTPATPIF